MRETRIASPKGLTFHIHERRGPESKKKRGMPDNDREGTDGAED